MTNTSEDKLLNIELILHKAGVGEGKKVADFGCGSGHLVFPAARTVGSRGLVYAVDILKSNLKNVKRRVYFENFSNIEIVWSDLEIFNGTKIESGSLDSAMLVNTLHQSGRRGAILREVNRMIKKNGILLVVDWKNVYAPFGPRPEDRPNPDHIIEACKKLGLNYEERFEMGKYFYGLIFHKL